jgi:hypothetical protein
MPATSSGSFKGHWDATSASLENGSWSQRGPEEQRIVTGLLWSYVQGGVLQLTFGPRSDQAWSGVYLTAMGRQVLGQGGPIPEDVDAYLRELAQQPVPLGDLEMFYVRESLLRSAPRRRARRSESASLAWAHHR